MVVYLDKPLHLKMGIKEGFRVLLENAPPGFERKLEDCPNGVQFVSPNAKDINFILVFVKSKNELQRQFESLKKKLAPKGMLWVAWPKLASKMDTDLKQNVVQKAGLDAGMVDVKICAIDETWSGLKFVVKKGDR